MPDYFKIEEDYYGEPMISSRDRDPRLHNYNDERKNMAHSHFSRPQVEDYDAEDRYQKTAEPPIERKKTKMAEAKQRKLTDALSVANKTAATVAARVEAGKVLVHKAIDVARSQCPAAAGAYLDHPLAGLVVANAVFAAAHQYLPDNERLRTVAEVMLEGAAQEFFAGVNIEAMLDKFLKGVNLSGVSLPVRLVEEGSKE